MRPGATGYPFNAARDALQDHARWAFRDLVDEVERYYTLLAEEVEVHATDADEALEIERLDDRFVTVRITSPSRPDRAFRQRHETLPSGPRSRTACRPYGTDAW